MHVHRLVSLLPPPFLSLVSDTLMSLCGRSTTQLYRHDLLLLHSQNAKTGGGGAQRFSSMLPTMNKIPGKLEKLVRNNHRLDSLVNFNVGR